jgi:hypothetical protein
MPSPRLDAALDQLRAARRFTLKTLEQVPQENWFAMPGGVTHVAWQVGHLAIAQYRLCLVRIRGDLPTDANLITPEWIGLFGKGSTPDPDPTKYPSIGAIVALVERVHAMALETCAAPPESDLDTPSLPQHWQFDTKLGAIQWCARHEMTHAGQIGLLRRMLGQKPWW